MTINFRTENVRLDSVLSDGFYTCSMTSRGVCVCVCVCGGGGGGVGKHKLCTYRARGVAESPWAGTPSYAKITHLLGPILSLPVPGRNRNAQLSIHQKLDSKTTRLPLEF